MPRPDHENDPRVREIKRLIDELNSDTTVEPSDTLDMLETIEAHVEPMIAAIRDDIDRAAK